MSIVNYGVSKHYAGSMVSDRCPLGYLFTVYSIFENHVFYVMTQYIRPLDLNLQLKIIFLISQPNHFYGYRGQSSVYSMPQSNKFIVYFCILLEMAYYLAGLAPVFLGTERTISNLKLMLKLMDKNIFIILCSKIVVFPDK